MSTPKPLPRKHRVFILTDIENEPDDQQSLVRYLLYANEFSTRGICAVTSAWLSDRTAPDTIRKVIRAYGQVVGNLNAHVSGERRYPSAEELLELVASGHPVYGEQALSLPLSPGAANLVNAITDAVDEEPVWILCWGGTNVLAEALQHIRKTTLATPSVEASLHARIRVYTISDQDSTGPWIRANFPGVFYICSTHGFGAFDMAAWQGISHPNAGRDMTKVLSPWLEANIQKGPLGGVYPTSEHIMEGDTPTFLYLIPNGLNEAEEPDYGGWGGRYRATGVGSRHFADAVDTTVSQTSGERSTDSKQTIARWREHFQNDFAVRMLWTLTPNFSEALHPPVAVVNGHGGLEPLGLSVQSNERVVLDASESWDPDTDSKAGQDRSHLSIQWYQYLEPTIGHPAGSEAVPRCTILPLSTPPKGGEPPSPNDCGFSNVVLGARVEVKVPDSKARNFFNLPPTHWLPHTGKEGMRYHIICQVSRRDGDVELPVRRYKRVILDAGLS